MATAGYACDTQCGVGSYFGYGCTGYWGFRCGDRTVASGGYGVGWNNCCVAARTSTAVYFIVISTYYNLLI